MYIYVYIIYICIYFSYTRSPNVMYFHIVKSHLNHGRSLFSHLNHGRSLFAYLNHGRSLFSHLNHGRSVFSPESWEISVFSPESWEISIRLPESWVISVFSPESCEISEMVMVGDETREILEDRTQERAGEETLEGRRQERAGEEVREGEVVAAAAWNWWTIFQFFPKPLVAKSLWLDFSLSVLGLGENCVF